jgi:uncharacterized protein (TIGR03086 family)
MTTPDFVPAATAMAGLLAGISDDQLGSPTPCPDYVLGDLLDHVGGLTKAFTWAATKDPASGSTAPSGDGSRLGDNWREEIASDLDGLVAAWRRPDAWTGMTAAGGVELPGEVAGLVALNELVIHGWDVAGSSGQPYRCDEATVRAAHDFVMQFSGPGSEESRGDAFGPVIEVSSDRPILDRLIGLSGRDPDWTPG